MAELVDALVSNTSGFTSMPVRSRLWVRKHKLVFLKIIAVLKDKFFFWSSFWSICQKLFFIYAINVVFGSVIFIILLIAIDSPPLIFFCYFCKIVERFVATACAVEESPGNTEQHTS